MDGKLLTKKDLAERWQVTESCIDNWRRDGILQQCKGIPAVRFSEQYITEIEGVKPERFSPLERKKLENEVNRLTEENQELKKILGNILSESAKITDIISKSRG